MKNINKGILIVTISFGLSAVISPLFAQERSLEVNYPEFLGTKIDTNLSKYIVYLINAAFGIVGFAFFATLAYAGFIYLTSGANPAKIKEARERATSAFLGVLILLSGYMILNIINPELVILKVPLIEKAITERKPLPTTMSKEVASLISRELPLGSAIDGPGGVFGSTTEAEVKQYLEKDFKIDFLSKNILTDRDGKTINRISNLNRYLTNLVNECSCGQMQSFCTKMEHGSIPVGCSGDPCPDDVREEINRVLGKDKEIIASLLKFKDEILKRRENLIGRLRKLGEIEQEILACKEEGKGLYSLKEYLDIIKSYEDSGDKISTITKRIEMDFLSFYCTVGGTTIDLPQTPYETESNIEKLTENLSDITNKISQESQRKISCPVSIPVGEIEDKFRELGVIAAVKMERINLLIDKMVEEIRDTINIVSECGSRNCKSQCSCIYNPCFGLCGPPPNPCLPFCLKLCLQGAGECVPKDIEKDPCDKKAINKEVDDIKWTEDEIFETLNFIDEIFYKADNIRIDINSTRTSLLLCAGPIEENLLPQWMLLDCQSAKGQYGPSGALIGYCHPRNFYCCTPNQKLNSTTNFPQKTGEERIGIVESKKFTPLPIGEDNCPQGWACGENVKRDKQYNDASESLKELLSCMKEGLENVKKSKDIKIDLGAIVNITDHKIYEGTCDWGKGPLEDNGCSFAHTTKENKLNISSHYGGPSCYLQKKSYAVDIRVDSLEEKKYAQEIIDVARQCNPSVYIQYGGIESPNHIHISIAGENHCGIN